MAWLQAAAAAGQSVLMQRYEEAFGKLDMPVAQVLLTHADLADRTRTNNARKSTLRDSSAAIPEVSPPKHARHHRLPFGSL